MTTVKCLNCKSNFQRRKSDINKSIKNDHKLFCSKQCSNQYKIKSKDVICKQCNIQFIKSLNQIKKSKFNFCSRSCSAKYYNSVIPKRQKQTKKCKICSNLVNRNKCQFCSHNCHSIFKWQERVKQIQKTNILHPKGYTSGSDLAKRYLAETRGPNCSICNQIPIWNGQPMIMILDHIDGIADNWIVDNIRLVCPNCDSQLPTFKSKNKNSCRPR